MDESPQVNCRRQLTTRRELLLPVGRQEICPWVEIGPPEQHGGREPAFEVFELWAEEQRLRPHRGGRHCLLDRLVDHPREGRTGSIRAPSARRGTTRTSCSCPLGACSTRSVRSRTAARGPPPTGDSSRPMSSW